MRNSGPGQNAHDLSVTSVDKETCHIRSSVWLEKIPGEDGDHQPAVLERRQRMANNQILAALNI